MAPGTRGRWNEGVANMTFGQAGDAGPQAMDRSRPVPRTLADRLRRRSPGIAEQCPGGLLAAHSFRTRADEPVVRPFCRGLRLREVPQLTRTVDLTRAGVGRTDLLFVSPFHGSGVPAPLGPEELREVCEQIGVLQAEGRRIMRNTARIGGG